MRTGRERLGGEDIKVKSIENSLKEICYKGKERNEAVGGGECRLGSCFRLGDRIACLYSIEMIPLRRGH